MSCKDSYFARHPLKMKAVFGQELKVFQLHIRAPATEEAPLLRNLCTHRLGAYKGGWW